jgi:hypothetical protein
MAIFGSVGIGLSDGASSSLSAKKFGLNTSELRKHEYFLTPKGRTPAHQIILGMWTWQHALSWQFAKAIRVLYLRLHI